MNVGYDVMTWQATIRTLADFRRRIGLRADRYLLVETVDDVHRILSADAIGRASKIALVRDGQRVTTTVIPREAP